MKVGVFWLHFHCDFQGLSIEARRPAGKAMVLVPASPVVDCMSSLVSRLALLASQVVLFTSSFAPPRRLPSPVQLIPIHVCALLV